MSKYKLIKKYPNCLHDIGTIIPHRGMGWEGIYEELERGLYSEFWELIKEKEFEIVKQELNVKAAFLYDGFTIKSIRRLSDNEVFSIGDKCNLSNGNGNRNPILRFEIRNERS